MMGQKFRLLQHSICRRVLSKRIGHLPSNKTYICFTFDTEEDWDNNNPSYYKSTAYYNSYKYITSGALYQLVESLSKRSVRATFYVTYNVARNIPEVLKMLGEKSQTIGVHVHPHVFEDVSYPYNGGPDGDKITSYSFTKKIEWMELTKGQIESIVGYDILLYRSGKLACDNETENAAKLAGFKAISNHKGIYYMKSPGIWNLGVGEEDLLDFEKFNELSKYIKHFEKRNRKEHIVIFSAHPMLLYDHSNNEIREKGLKIFLEFIDYLGNLKNTEIISQYELLRMVQEWSGVK